MSSPEENEQKLEDFIEYCKNHDKSKIPDELKLEHHLASENAMDDDCWKSTAVIDNDMLNEKVERVNWVHFPDEVPFGDRLLKAVEKGCTALVIEILDNHPEVVNTKDSDGYSPLHRACYQGFDDIVELLLDHGADVQSRTLDGWSPLHSACRWNKVECAKKLIAAGADVNAKSDGDQTPLHIACTSQACSSVIRMLLWNPDTDVSIRNNSGELAEKIALSNSTLGPLFLLKHRWVDVDPFAASYE